MDSLAPLAAQLRLSRLLPQLPRRVAFAPSVNSAVEFSEEAQQTALSALTTPTKELVLASSALPASCAKPQECRSPSNVLWVTIALANLLWWSTLKYLAPQERTELLRMLEWSLSARLALLETGVQEWPQFPHLARQDTFVPLDRQALLPDLLSTSWETP